MLTKDEAAEWANALESGQYRKTTGFCALSVLAFVKDEYYIPFNLLSWQEQRSIIRFNDHLNYDFQQIADIVRQRYQVSAE